MGFNLSAWALRNRQIVLFLMIDLSHLWLEGAHPDDQAPDPARLVIDRLGAGSGGNDNIDLWRAAADPFEVSMKLAVAITKCDG